jgi:hypothetical protein
VPPRSLLKGPGSSGERPICYEVLGETILSSRKVDNHLIDEQKHVVAIQLDRLLAFIAIISPFLGSRIIVEIVGRLMPHGHIIVAL